MNAVDASSIDGYVPDDSPISTDIPDPEALAREVARLRSVVRDLIVHLGGPALGLAAMERFLWRLDN